MIKTLYLEICFGVIQLQYLSGMGQQLPISNNPPIKVQQKDTFQARYVQRIKQTPYTDAVLYTSHPLIFVDPVGPCLLELVKPRLGTKQLFPEQQVKKLMVCVLSGLRELLENGYQGHGDVSLETIYYSKKDKYFKLTHPVFNEQSGYLLTKHGKRFTTLSPEQLSALSELSQNSQTSIKSDTFALGIALCQICTLTPSSDIYCPDTYSIFHLQIQKRLKLVEQYYSPVVLEMVGLFLQYDPEARPNVYQLLQHLEELARSQSTYVQPQSSKKPK